MRSMKDREIFGYLCIIVVSVCTYVDHKVHFTSIVRFLYLHLCYTIYISFKAKYDLLKMNEPFWGGVEVACSTLRKGQCILPKAVHFRALFVILL